MLQKIEVIRKKPKEVRDRYAFWSAFFITFVIASFWLASVPARLAVFSNTSIIEKEDVQGGFSRSFSSLKASLLNSIQKPEEVQIVPEVKPADEPDDTIDFNTFFATTSTTTKKAMPEVAPTGRKVLIGTSSKDSSSTPIRQE